VLGDVESELLVIALENVNHSLEEKGLENESWQQLSEQNVFVLSIHELNNHVNGRNLVVFQIFVHVDTLEELLTLTLVDDPSNSESNDLDRETLVVA
jgi:hypothetical protein